MNDKLIDDDIINPGVSTGFGSAVPVQQSMPDIPDFLRRTAEPAHEATHEVVATQADTDAALGQDHGDDAGRVHAGHTDTAEADSGASGGEFGGAGPALVSNAPSEIARTHDAAGDDGVAENERAVIGDNGAPQDREEMLKDMWKDIGAYGRDSGKGAAALPRLGLRVIRAAADGLISTDKPKDGSKSDAVRIYERYAENDSKHADHTSGGLKANAAKLNALIGLGASTICDGVEVADRTVKLRDEMEAADAKPKPLFAGLVDVARAQAASDTPLTDDAIKNALTKTSKEKTLADEWAAVHKKVEKLVSGENAAGIKDQSEGAVKIEEMIREHVNNFATAAADEDMVMFCMERGMSREDAKKFVAARA